MTASALVKQVEYRRMQIEHENGVIRWIYFFYNPTKEIYKIGKSNNPRRRCKEISTIMFDQLDHVFSFQGPESAEKVLHRILGKFHHAYEWFDAHDEIDQLIECFEDFDVDSGVDNPVLSAEDVLFVLDDWANSYGRGKSAKNFPVEIGENLP